MSKMILTTSYHKRWTSAATPTTNCQNFAANLYKMSKTQSQTMQHNTVSLVGTFGKMYTLADNTDMASYTLAANCSTSSECSTL